MFALCFLSSDAGALSLKHTERSITSDGTFSFVAPLSCWILPFDWKKIACPSNFLVLQSQLIFWLIRGSIKSDGKFFLFLIAAVCSRSNFLTKSHLSDHFGPFLMPRIGFPCQVSVLADDIIKNVEFDALKIVFNKFHSVVSFLPTVSTVLSPEVTTILYLRSSLVFIFCYSLISYLMGGCIGC